MSERAPSMQFYFRQFSGDEHVMAMDLETVGAHILMMCAAGASKGGYRLPADDGVLRAILRNPPAALFERVKRQLTRGAWKQIRDRSGQLWWVQNGMRRSMLKQKAYRDKQAKLAREAWAKKQQSQPEASHKVASSEPMPARARSSSSSSSASLKTKSRAQTARELPPAKPAGVSPTRPKRTEEQQRQIVDARDKRLAKEAAVQTEAHAGAGPEAIGATISQAAREHALKRAGPSAHEIEQEKQRQKAELANYLKQQSGTAAEGEVYSGS